MVLFDDCLMLRFKETTLSKIKIAERVGKSESSEDPADFHERDCTCRRRFGVPHAQSARERFVMGVQHFIMNFHHLI